ncbi:MAG: hypothetical protein WC729_15970 [Sphingomonas sp.]|jgi:hypothetical protein|uniref:hypothetical protein n=1 Tax=Sphingomonas sp. TaxID=28214 RepID=UPI00356A3171
MGDDAVIATMVRLANEWLVHRDHREEALGALAARVMKFGRVEVGQPDLDPGFLVASRSDAEAVAITDIANLAGEG